MREEQRREAIRLLAYARAQSQRLKLNSELRFGMQPEKQVISGHAKRRLAGMEARLSGRRRFLGTAFPLLRIQRIGPVQIEVEFVVVIKVALDAIGTGAAGCLGMRTVTRLAIVDARHQDIAGQFAFSCTGVTRLATEHAVRIVLEHAVWHPSFRQIGRPDLDWYALFVRLNLVAVHAPGLPVENCLIGLLDALIDPVEFFFIQFDGQGLPGHSPSVARFRRRSEHLLTVLGDVLGVEFTKRSTNHVDRKPVRNGLLWEKLGIEGECTAMALGAMLVELDGFHVATRTVRLVAVRTLQLHLFLATGFLAVSERLQDRFRQVDRVIEA